MKVIFGAWDTEAGEEREVILRDSWEFITRDGKQRRQPGYVQALEHLEYVRQGYDLYTFVMGHSLSEYSEDISRIKKFSHHLQLRYLVQEEGVWYACREAQYLPEELPASASFSEGAKTQILVNAYERDPAARKACLRHHGYRCQGCGFSFEGFCAGTAEISASPTTSQKPDFFSDRCHNKLKFRGRETARNKQVPAYFLAELTANCGVLIT